MFFDLSKFGLIFLSIKFFLEIQAKQKFLMVFQGFDLKKKSKVWNGHDRMGLNISEKFKRMFKFKTYKV